MFVGVGVAADVDKQGAVIGGGAGLVIEPGQLAQAHGDPALAQHVLHGLPKAEVNAERECGEKLSKPNLRAEALVHAGSVGSGGPVNCRR